MTVPTSPAAPPPDDDEARVARLLAHAGPPPEVPEEDLATIDAAARWAWRAAVVRHRRMRRRRLAVALLPLAAGLVVAFAWWRLGVGLAAAPVATVAAADGVATLDGAAVGRDAVVPAGGDLATAAEAHLALRLASGVELRLAAGSRLRVAAADAVELVEGAVYVDTGGDAGGTVPTSRTPRLVVATPLGPVRDVGTRFAVRWHAATATLVVRVRDGAVVLARGGEELRATAGEELAVGADGAHERRPVGVHGAGWEWVLEAAPAFAIDGRSLGDLLRWVARETGWEVRFEDPALAAAVETIELHGELGDVGPEGAALALLPGAALEGELAGDVLLVRRATATTR